MDINETAAKYLEKDKLKYAPLLNHNKHYPDRTIFASCEGVLIEVVKNVQYMLSAKSEKSLADMLALIKKARVVFTTENDYEDIIRKRFDYRDGNVCYQYVYKGAPIEYEKRLNIIKLDESYTDKVASIYKLIGKRRIREALIVGDVYGGYYKGELVGFIGQHEDRSMGMLEIVPKYRRMGFGLELERYLINKLKAEGVIPYGHVIVGNDKSVGLQQKVGLTKYDKPVYWLF